MKLFLSCILFFTYLSKGLSNTNDSTHLEHYLIKYKNVILVRSSGNCFTLLCFNNNLKIHVLKGIPEDSTYTVDFSKIKILRLDTFISLEDLLFEKTFFAQLKKMYSQKYINRKRPLDSFRFEFYFKKKKMYDAFGIHALQLNNLFLTLKKRTNFNLNPVCNF